MQTVPLQTRGSTEDGTPDFTALGAGEGEGRAWLPGSHGDALLNSPSGDQGSEKKHMLFQEELLIRDALFCKLKHRLL